MPNAQDLLLLCSTFGQILHSFAVDSCMLPYMVTLRIFSSVASPSSILLVFFLFALVLVSAAALPPCDVGELDP